MLTAKAKIYFLFFKIYYSFRKNCSFLFFNTIYYYSMHKKIPL